MSWAQVCHCGHDRSSHFEEKHTCLGVLCSCEVYTHRDDPLPVSPKPEAWPDWTDLGEEAIATPTIPIPGIAWPP